MNEQRKKRLEDNEYLWNRTGVPDAEIQRLEQVLAEFRATDLAAPFLAGVDSAPQHSSWWQSIASHIWTPRFAAATLTFASITIALLLSSRDAIPSRDTSGWNVELAEARPDSSVTAGSPTGKTELRIGEAFETDSASKATIAVADVGRLEVAPSTRLRLLQSAEGRKRVALDHGTIQATIWAPPGEFVVDTPSAVAVDLGCMYTLHVEESGSGLLRTTLGWVGFRSNGRESFIPAGAAAAIYSKTGPGLPYFENSTDSFHAAISQFDSASDASAQHAVALQVILREARARDALTLWHLLARVSDAERPAVYDRLAALVPPPPGITRENTLRLDRTMLDAWWNALDLGDIGLWRHFEQSWADPVADPNRHSARQPN
jgi:hypothetical protein